jgi:tRNA threonylcarbamoyladenosine biosynthesis protein TsaB
MPKKLILQLETATTMCSVALASDGEVLALKELNERNIHASQITLFIDEVMKSADKKYSELDAIAISKGPGSYTGLRIGVSTAKGLCYGLNIPLLSVDTLEAMAEGLIQSRPVDPETLLCPMIDARRMEVYTAVFDYKLHPLETVNAKILDHSTFKSYLSGHPIVFFGDGAEKSRSLYAECPNYNFVEFENSAAHMSSIALKKLLNDVTENVAYFEPFYLKDFIPGVAK